MMLILTRRVGEKIIIGDNIEIVVLGITDGQTKIGLSAPINVKIIRSELLERTLKRMVDDSFN